MPIPKNITPDHIIEAIAAIDSMREIPANRKSRKYFVKHNDKLYPPKYVISFANVYPNKEELDPHASNFTTYDAQSYLQSKGFIIYQIRNKELL
jgi:hypothetical protein